MSQRIAFLDYLRIVACLMVIAVHACEFYYIGETGQEIASASDAFWVTVIDSMFRCSVPLFVMISGYLLVPVSTSTAAFYRRRMMRVVVPFLVWLVLFAVLPALWSDVDASSRLLRLFTNFNDDSGHLWFVYMLIGLYLFMPVISPWLRSCSRREEEAFLVLWFRLRPSASSPWSLPHSP